MVLIWRQPPHTINDSHCRFELTELAKHAELIESRKTEPGLRGAGLRGAGLLAGVVAGEKPRTRAALEC